ncbi:MAG TPA: outer membrane protein assembly factor [Prolixibacteraceae bacterium]|nr:outer membrane protein assembly factor [Prolixibacteraceae bacterium]
MILFVRNRFFYSGSIILFMGILLLGSCNPTRFVPEGKYLLNKISVKVDDKNVKREELKTHIRQKENLRILGAFKFHLWVYNLSSKNKENDWLKRIGEAPVLYDEVQANRSKDQLRIYLRNKGYYNAVVVDTLMYKRNNKKANLVFDILARQPYRIGNYVYLFKDEHLRGVILNDSLNQLLKPGDVFDLDILNAERQRVSNHLKNSGYYKFSEDFISFTADTNFFSHRVDLTVNIDDASLRNDDNEVVPHLKYKIRNFLIDPTHQVSDMSGTQIVQSQDSVKIRDYIITYSGDLNYKPGLFFGVNRLRDSAFYSMQNAEKTYRALSRLKQFKVINIGFLETDSLSNDSVPLLDCRMQLSPLPRHNFSVDIEGTNSSGNLGVAGNFNFQHRNVFRGAEVFDFQIRGARERQQALVNNSSLDFNTRELGFESSLTFPQFLSFVRLKGMLNFQIPETKLTAGFNYQSRPDYTRTITNLKFGYDWKTTAFQYHTLNLVDLNYVNLYAFNPAFINSIEDLYIKSSFTDHLIFASNYSWMYNTQNINKREDYKYFKLNLESAGNLLSLFSRTIGKEKAEVLDSISNQISSYYEVLNTRFAQYLKGDFEYRYGHIIDKSSSLVGRAFVGIGIPYGNFDVLPFEKKYFTGGANGIRAWQVRSLGPGSYKAPSDIYPNQSSDIKLEANLEYRFKLFWLLEGALFMDAGNIWAINSKDNREGAVFKMDQFCKQIAVGSGLGLRFDFTYFIFRLDLGIKIRDPSLPEGKRFVQKSYPVSSDHFNLSFAIGYPF